MSWRAKIASVPMSLAMAVMLAGSADRETAGIVLYPDGGSTTVCDEIVSVRGGAAIAEGDELPAPLQSFDDGDCYIGEGRSLRFSGRRPQAVHLLHLLEHRALHFFHDLFQRLLSFAEERIEKRGVAHVVALFAVLEVDVDRLPEHVVEDLEDLLNHERVAVWWRERVLSRLARQAERQRPPLPCRTQRTLDRVVGLGEREAHHHVVRM